MHYNKHKQKNEFLDLLASNSYLPYIIQATTNQFSFNCEWNKAWMLVINWYIRVASEFPNDLRLRILGNLEIWGKSQTS